MRIALAVLFAVFLAAMPARGSTLTIDFTHSDWANANGHGYFMYQGAQLEPIPGSTVSQSSQYGIGVSSPGDTEQGRINGDEVLGLHFWEPVLLESLTLTDVHFEKHIDGAYYERVMYSVNGLPWEYAFAPESNVPGENIGDITIHFEFLPYTTAIYLSAAYPYQGINEFGLSRLTYREVPEPSLVLLGVASILGMGYRQVRRRRNS